MEIEAKFKVPDERTFRKLKTVARLGVFTLSPGKTKRLHDTYLDTQDRRLLHAGYACRSRKEAGKILITLKELKTSTNSIYRREEFEVALPDDLPPAQWPSSPARDLVLDIVGDKSLVPLFDLRQTRTVRGVWRDQSPIAELSLDKVRLPGSGRTPAFLDLECELVPQGTESDLGAIEISLQREWKLQPERCSKFERALQFISATTANMKPHTKIHRSAPSGFVRLK